MIANRLELLAQVPVFVHEDSVDHDIERKIKVGEHKIHLYIHSIVILSVQCYE